MTGTAGQWLDQASQLRVEDAFDLEAFDAWFRQHRADLPVGLPGVRQYARGASNLTYEIRYGDQRFVMRRPPSGQKAASAHNMGREFRIQSALAPIFNKVPPMVALCDDADIMGSEFYVMSHVPGIILRRNLPKGMQLRPERVRALCEATLDGLVELHQLDYAEVGLDQMARGEGYNVRQIEGWCQRFKQSKTWNVASGRLVMDWLTAHCPDEVGLCLIHGDYRLDNLVLEPNLEDSTPIEIRAVLDWELATIGDPLMDLGNSMAYWVQAEDDFYFRGFRRQPTHLEGMMSRQEVVAYYAQATGRDIQHWPFYEVYGLFRLAVIAQQIYYRYHHGQTRNPQFKHFWVAVNYLLWRCRQVIKRAE